MFWQAVYVAFDLSTASPEFGKELFLLSVLKKRGKTMNDSIIYKIVTISMSCSSWISLVFFYDVKDDKREEF